MPLTKVAFLGGGVVPYRFYILDRTGGYMDVVEARCAGDEEAVRSAREVGRGTGIEV